MTMQESEHDREIPNRRNPYCYVNEGSSSEQQSDDNHCRRHQFVDSTLQLGMMGQSNEDEDRQR